MPCYSLKRKATKLEQHYGSEPYHHTTAPFLACATQLKRVKWKGSWWDVVGILTNKEEN